MILKNTLLLIGRPCRYALLILLCGFVFSVSSGQAQETKFAWQFKQGDQFQVETTKLSKRTSTLDSRITVTLSNVVIQFDWTVESVDDAGTATVTQELTGFSIDIGDPAVPHQAIAYASDAVPADLSSAMRKLQRKSKPLIGLKCDLKIASTGEITSIRLDADSQKKLGKLENAPNLQALFSEESLQKISRDFSLTAVPAEANATNWSKQETRQSGFGEISIDHQFSAGPAETMKGRKLINVDVVSKLTPAQADIAAKKPAAKNEISQSLVSFAGNGSITFDADGGYFSNSQFETKIKSERKYREKVILTSLENETRIKIEKK